MSSSLSFQEVEELIEQVISNKKLAELLVNDVPFYVVFSAPSPTCILQSRFIYKKTIFEAKQEGLPSTADIDQLVANKGIVSAADKEQLEVLEKKIFAQEKLLSMTRIPGRRAPIEEVLAKLNAEAEVFRSKGQSLYYLSQERKADEACLLYLTWAGTFNVTDEHYWNSFQDFENETNIAFRNEVILAFLGFNRGLSTSLLRFIARHNLWRVRYVSAQKIGGSLFSNDLHSLTPDQLALLYWSSYYQSIYEMLPDERPSDEVIEDDERLNQFMEAYHKDREKVRSDRKLSGNSGKSNKPIAQELIVTANHPDYLTTVYSENRVKAAEGEVAVEATSPNSRLARNRRAALREGRPGGH